MGAGGYNVELADVMRVLTNMPTVPLSEESVVKDSDMVLEVRAGKDRDTILGLEYRQRYSYTTAEPRCM